MDQVRMTAAVDALSRAITGEMEPADFAGSLQDILSPEQLHLLKALPEAQVTDVLLASAGGRYPVLLAESAKGYITAVLQELKSGSSPD
jgi:Mg/Co/Ni transporter MgtE